MERTFREGSVQCLSKHSIVIVNSNGGRKVYKKIIWDVSRRTLLFPFYMEILSTNVYYLQSETKKDICYVFDLVQPPLTCVQPRTCLLEFVSTVKDGITSLHERKIAHLDIKLENIYFDVNSNMFWYIEVSKLHYLLLSLPIYLIDMGIQ